MSSGNKLLLRNSVRWPKFSALSDFSDFELPNTAVCERVCLCLRVCAWTAFYRNCIILFIHFTLRYSRFCLLRCTQLRTDDRKLSRSRRYIVFNENGVLAYFLSWDYVCVCVCLLCNTYANIITRKTLFIIVARHQSNDEQFDCAKILWKNIYTEIIIHD